MGISSSAFLTYNSQLNHNDETVLMSQSLKTIAAITFTVLMFSCAFVAIRIGLQGGYSPGALALLRYLTASVVIAIFYIKTPKTKNIPLAVYVQAIFIGIFGIGIYNYALNTGETQVPAGIASFIICLAPVITAIFSISLLKEKISAIAWSGLVISVVGVGIIASSQVQDLAFDKGVLYVIIATFCNAFYILLQKPLLKYIRGIEFAAIAIWSGATFLLLFSGTLWHELPQVSTSATLAGLFLGIFPGGLAYIAWSYALQYWPASKTSNTLYFIPILATAIAWLLIDEVPTLMNFIGGIIALFGAIIFQTCYSKRLKSANEKYVEEL